MEVDYEDNRNENRPYHRTVQEKYRNQRLKIVREKYLRSDINCGSQGCLRCQVVSESEYKLDDNPMIYSDKFNFKHYLLPDAGFVLRQIDVLEELSNVIFLQSVMEDVFRFNVSKYKRIREGIKNRKWTYFLNEHHRGTYVKRFPSETTDDRSHRALMTCYQYFEEHFKSRGIAVVVLSDDPKFLEKTEIKPEHFSSGENYVSKMTGQFKDLEDKLCKIPYDEDEAINKYSKGDFSYPPHIDSKTIQDLIKQGKLYQGAYRSWNFYEGFVRIDGDGDKEKDKGKTQEKLQENELLIQGLNNVNRASEGDIVALELLPEDQWSIPSGLVVVEPLEQEIALTSEKVVEENHEDTDDPNQEKEVHHIDEEDILAAAKSEVDKKKRRTGRVVGIIRRKWQPCAGVIRKSDKEGTSLHFFLPDNKKIPRIRIETRNVDRFHGKKIIVQIDQWPVTSRYPVGHYIKVLGDAGSIETETSAILHDHGIPHEPFSKSVEACLPSIPYQIDPEEFKKRKDFRDLLVCSVDPPGCTDIDDALHCRRNSDGTFEVGVHIADVSEYVLPNTALDEEAAKRSTSVYLADRRIDMIPSILSSNICSLHCGTDKLVFSVVWKLSSKAEILDTKFYKGIINSKASLTYAEAQLRLDIKDDKNTKKDPITTSLKGLSYLAQLLKKKRFDNGALMLSTIEVNEEGEAEEDCEESHSMVEEFMLLANCSVAEYVLSMFREFALLRRHPVPPPANFGPLLLAAKSHKLNIIVDQGSKALNASLETLPDELKSILRVLTTRCMTQALYCCSGTTSADEYPHFGLAVPLYTHFTSPIRRYADLMVHRLLATAIGVAEADPKILDAQKIHRICENINVRHRMAQYASRASNNIHKSIQLKGKKEEHTGYIMFVRRNALQVYVPKYAMEGFIFFPKGSVYNYNEKEGEVKFGSVTFRPLDKLVIGLTLEENKDKVVYRLVKPNVPGLSD